MLVFDEGKEFFPSLSTRLIYIIRRRAKNLKKLLKIRELFAFIFLFENLTETSGIILFLTAVRMNFEYMPKNNFANRHKEDEIWVSRKMYKKSDDFRF